MISNLRVRHDLIELLVRYVLGQKFYNFQDFVFNSDRTLQLELIDPGAGDFTDRDNSDLISPKVALPLADPQLDDRRDQDYFFAMLCQKA